MNRLVSSSNTVRPMLALALPVLAEESLTMLVGYTDWWLAGHFLAGAEYKAAMGLMSYVLWLLPSMFAAVAIGATALIARFVGAGDRDAARRVAHQALLLGLVLTFVVLAAVLLGGRSLVHIMQLEGRAAELAVRYIWILTPVIPAIMLEQVGVACLRGAGDTVSGFVAKSIVNVVNLVVSALLVVGPGNIPKLGWEGLAIGTACGHGLGGLLVLGLLIRGRAGMRLELAGMRPDRELIRRLWRIGMPGGVDVLAVLGCHFVYLAIINSLGVAAAAAHGLGVQIEALAYLTCYAFHVAASTMTGQLLGAGESRRATRCAIEACFVGGAMLTAAALVFYFAGAWLAGFFTGDIHDPTAMAAGKLLKIVAFSTPPLAVMMVLTGSLRGAGDTRWPLVVTFVGLIAVRLPLACWFAWESFQVPGLDITVTGLGLGVAGAWWAMVIDVVLRSILLIYRFWQGRWKEMAV
ncbi:MAG: MATE family efflux transporter [Planctomycetota bacterium]|nr:MATE family efflux transporter [Planctomycetota bacterium]